MRTYLDCYPCFLRQALEAARLRGASETQQKNVLNQVLAVLRNTDLSRTPPEIGYLVHKIVRTVLGDNDPYAEVKEGATRLALDLYPRMRSLVAAATDPLDVAVRLAIAGNIIDAGPRADYDLEAAIGRVPDRPLSIDHGTAFRVATHEASSILFLADNAGETVFDRLLIETLGRPVVYAVKGAPVLNDATREDACAAGLDDIAEIIDNGGDFPGTILARCSKEFRCAFDSAPLVIAKGQANYETLSQEGTRLFFLLQVKCPVIGRDVGAPTGGLVLKQGSANSPGR